MQFLSDWKEQSSYLHLQHKNSISVENAFSQSRTFLSGTIATCILKSFLTETDAFLGS